MEFKSASQVQSICWELRTGDWPRDRNRTEINKLMNGHPPYTAQEVKENGIAINVNYLEGTKLCHDARSQFYQAFFKPGNFFSVRTDKGEVWKRDEISTKVTSEINRVMKNSTRYYEAKRSVIANNVLHGIGPALWENGDRWANRAMGVEDLLVPANTELDFDNLPFFCFLRSFTAPELMRLTNWMKGARGWNMKMVRKCIEYVDRESMALLGSNYPEVWSPSKLEERVKSDGGYYMGDQVPTIDCFDFYYYSDQGDDWGWRRRIVLDDWSGPAGGGLTGQFGYKADYEFGKNQWLYSSGDRKVADSCRQIFSCQFADLSAVGPFRYHTVRSLGFLIYSVCHMQNRLRCKFNEAVFEALMMYFRVKSMDDAQRSLKVNMFNRGFIDEALQFIPAAERFQVNADLVALGLKENQQIIDSNSSSFVQNQNFSKDRVEKTKFQVMAEVNAMNQLVTAAIAQAYKYQCFEYQEILRRFMKKNSRDPDVNEFRARVLKSGVPPDYLDPGFWEVNVDQVLGGGNKTMEMTIISQLLEMFDRFDPEPQRMILRDAVLALTDDSAKAKALVPEKPVAVTDSVHDAQLAAGALMQGLPVALKTGMNHIEYVETLLADMALIISQGQKSGNMLPIKDITGLQNIAAHIAQHIQIIAKDEHAQQVARQFSDQLGKLMNEVKGFASRLQQAMEAQQKSNGNGQMDPKEMAKLQAQQMQNQAKIQNTRESHAQRAAQKQIGWEKEESRKDQQHQLDMQRQVEQTRLDLEGQRLKMLQESKRKPKSE